MTEVVPGLGKNQGRSEAIVLDRTIEYLKELIDERKMLIQEVHKDVATKADRKEGSMSR